MKISAMNRNKKRASERLYNIRINGKFYKCITLCENGFIHNY